MSWNLFVSCNIVSNTGRVDLNISSNSNTRPLQKKQNVSFKPHQSAHVVALCVAGLPPMTGSTTLNLQVSDRNDNLPRPVVDTVAMCLSDVPTTANIATSDLDGDLFGGPFYYELLGDVAGRWRLDPDNGFSAGLVKEPDVYAGRHKVKLKISDLQGQSAVYNISVMVCDCSVSGNCLSRRASGTRVSFSTVGIIIAALLLPLGKELSWSSHCGIQLLRNLKHFLKFYSFKVSKNKTKPQT